MTTGPPNRPTNPNTFSPPKMPTRAKRKKRRSLPFLAGALAAVLAVVALRVAVAATGRCLADLAPRLREWGIRLGLENHWDYSTYEILEIVKRAGADVVGSELPKRGRRVALSRPELRVRRLGRL